MQDDQNPVAPPAAPDSADPDSQWQFTGDPEVTVANQYSDPQYDVPDEVVNWTASEFIAHDKTSGWYLMLTLASIVAAGITFFMTRQDKLTTAIVLITGGLFGVIAARKPRELPYKIDSSGLQIGDKHFPYANFKSYSLVQEEGVESIWLLPLQRFVPGLSIYFSAEDKEQILDVLDNHLPVEQRELDFVDRLMHKIRF